jgi:hypothetical protein
MTEAWIGFAGGVFAVLVSVAVAFRQSRVEERLERVRSDLATEQHRREALIDRDMLADEVLGRYREPLGVAAFDLQSRLYNILRLNFFGLFGGDHKRSDDATRTTLFRLAQYFGWTEILRRDIQFLSFPEAEDTRKVAHLQSEIAKRFLSDGYGEELMIWSDEQRALGERMIVEEHGKVLCMGYAAFRDCCEAKFAPWYGRLSDELERGAADERLREVQHLLCDLVETLDTHRVRYAEDLKRA